MASVHSVRQLITGILPSAVDDHISGAIEKWQLFTGTEIPPEQSRGNQKVWDTPVVSKVFSDLMDNSGVNPETKARLLAVSSKESGAWLNALPSPSLGNMLDNDSLRISVALRLGAPVCEPHICVCGLPVDKSGHHGLRCKKSAGRWSRHGAINDLIRRSLVSAGVPCIGEPPGVSRDDGKRPDGLTLVPWKMGRCMIWDATVRDTLASSYLSMSAASAGSAANEAERRKTLKYRSLQSRFVFIPLGFETFGSWGSEAKELIQCIGRKLIDKTGEARASEFLRQRLSIEIQRGNAASVMGTMPTTKALDEIFFVS